MSTWAYRPEPRTLVGFTVKGKAYKTAGRAIAYARTLVQGVDVVVDVVEVSTNRRGRRIETLYTRVTGQGMGGSVRGASKVAPPERKPKPVVIVQQSLEAFGNSLAEALGLGETRVIVSRPTVVIDTAMPDRPHVNPYDYEQADA